MFCFFGIRIQMSLFPLFHSHFPVLFPDQNEVAFSLLSPSFPASAVNLCGAKHRQGMLLWPGNARFN